jgi:hypothetical protein
LDSQIIYDPQAKTYVGIDDSNRIASWLYANYASYMRSTNSRVIGMRRFGNLLEDLCCSQLKLIGVEKGRDRKGSFFIGLRIRGDNYDFPRPITEEVVTEVYEEPPPSVTDETLTGDGCDGFTPQEQACETEDNAVDNNNYELRRTESVPKAITNYELSCDVGETELVIAIGQKADYSGECVEIIGWKDNGKKIWIQLNSGRQVLVKRGCLRRWRE